MASKPSTGRRWLEVVAPSVLAAFEHAQFEPDGRDEELASELEAERELIAECEAQDAEAIAREPVAP